MKMSSFWKSIMTSDSSASSKRLITLIIALHFIIASFATLFIAFYVVFYLPKGRVEISLLDMLKQIMEYDFYIILSGLGFITTENMGMILLEKAKSKNAVVSNIVDTVDPREATIPQESGDPIEISDSRKPE